MANMIIYNNKTYGREKILQEELGVNKIDFSAFKRVYKKLKGKSIEFVPNGNHKKWQVKCDGVTYDTYGDFCREVDITNSEFTRFIKVKALLVGPIEWV